MVGMGQTLYHAETPAREVFDQADDVLGFSLSRLCFGGPLETLTDTVNAQPAILTTSTAILRVLERRTELRPTLVAGHSLGEFTALVCAGALDFVDALHLVRERGRLMAAAGEAQPGGMMSVLGLEAALLAEVCARAQDETGEVVQLANDNCPGQLVISGSHGGLERARTLAEQAGAKRAVPLQVSIPAHSSLMAGAAAEFAKVVAQVPVKAPAVAVIGNSTAVPLRTVAAVREEMVSQLTHMVRWTETVRHVLSQGVDTLVEIGPDDVLTRLGRRIDGKSSRVSIQNEQDIADFVSRTTGSMG